MKLLHSIGFHCTSGTERPEVLFVVEGGPTLEEMLRGEPLVNEDAALFAKRYLEPLGLSRDDVAVAWLDVNDEQAMRSFDGTVRKLAPQAVVFMAASRDLVARDDLAEMLVVNMPRFARVDDVWKNSHREEATRKMKALRKNLDARWSSVRASNRPLLKAARLHDGDRNNSERLARLYKADAPKRIVYGVVLDPYVVDLQEDWIPAGDIEATAHEFVKNRGYISDQHVSIAEDAQLVESFIEAYPSVEDARRAARNEPHRAYRRKFGNDVVHSGAWIIAVQLSQRLWADYESGKIDAFSIEGWGTRTPGTVSEMPQVNFIDLEAV